MTGLRELLTGWRDRTWPHRLVAGSPWSEPATVVAVAGVSTRAGATTLAVLLADAYAGPGRGRVLVADAATGLSSLGRLVADLPAGSLAEVWPLLAPHLERTAEGLWTVTAAGAEPPDLMACQRALAALSPHFSVAVLDCGWLALPQSRFLVGLAGARLLATPASVDGVLAAAAALDELEAARSRTLVGLVGSREPVTETAAAERLLGPRGGDVRPLPWCADLAAGDEPSAELRAATVALAAELLRRGRP